MCYNWSIFFFLQYIRFRRLSSNITDSIIFCFLFGSIFSKSLSLFLLFPDCSFLWKIVNNCQFFKQSGKIYIILADYVLCMSKILIKNKTCGPSNNFQLFSHLAHTIFRFLNFQLFQAWLSNYPFFAPDLV